MEEKFPTIANQPANVPAKAQDEVYCASCGAVIKQAAEICPKCGVRVKPIATNSAPVQVVVNQNNNAAIQQEQLSKTTALLLALFLGWAGIHRFYVGKSGTGLIYLFSAGICGIGWIIDVLMILTGGFRDSNGNKLK
ncbi:hypothetical protein R83H12_00652 [Fibrobacteria bacterium R8-3-H12]